MRWRFSCFFSLSIIIGFGVQIPIFLDLLRWIGSVWTSVFISLINLSFIYRIIKGRFYDRSVPLWRLYLTEVPFYIWWTTCLLYAWVKLPLLLIQFSLLGVVNAGEWSLADLFSQSVFLWAFTYATYSILWRRRIIRVDRITIPFENLPDAYEGYRIVQMTDLHCGRFTPGTLIAQWVEQVNALAPNLIVLTGDYITAGNDYLEELAEALSNLSAPDGVIAVLGNHDYFGNVERLVLALKKVGIEVLRNQGRLLPPRKSPLFLAGVDDTWTKRANIKLALAERPTRVPTILLAHDPSLFPEAAQNQVELMLSGHTHGGQIAFPIASRILNLSRFYHRYVAGLYKMGSSTLYVCRGAGTTGPPVRLNVPGEVSEITLCRKNTRPLSHKG